MKIIAKKSLGQNFLTSTWPLKEMVERSALKEGDFVLEVGPGKGALTEELLKEKVKVIAVEKDYRLIEFLGEKFKKEILDGKMFLIEGDVLNKEVQEKVSQLCDKNSYKLLANIPYYITGEIFRLFLEEIAFKPESVCLIVQKEVAERVVAKDGKESILSVSVKLFGEPKCGSTVKRGSFNPAPNVDSAILFIKLKEQENLEISSKKILEIVKLGFKYKRKMLISNLKEGLIKKSDKKDQNQELNLEQIFDNLKIDRKVRAEDLKVEDWINLTKNL